METPTNPENQIIDQNISANIIQKNNYKILFLIFLTLFLVVSSILAILLFNQKTPNISKIIEIEEQKTVPTEKPNSEITENSVIPTTKLTTTPATQSSTNQNLLTYENKEIGFSFKYPKTLGEFVATTEKGETGFMYAGKFSKDTSSLYRIGGPSVDYSVSRGGSFFDFSGYDNKNNIITVYHLSNPVSVLSLDEIKKIYKNKNGIEVVLINGFTSKDEDNLPIKNGVRDEEIGALINTNNKTYPGIAFKFPKTLESEMMIILDSLDITK